MASRDGGRFPAKWTPTRRLLKEWRGFDPEERPDRSGLLSEFLGRLLPELGLDSRIRESDINEAWKGVVGEFIAMHSRPERLVGGILQVRVIQPSVRYELDRTWKPEILRKLREQFGEKTIRDLKFIL
jgi:predicted nucleic acid-binding Zn ribbon protein